MGGGESSELASDEVLVAQTRTGNQRAFAELWHRHYQSGVRVARQFTSSIDADDLVSEAYTRIYQRVLAGGGPVGAFRPYLYTTIRNLASSWGAAHRDVQVDDIADFEDPRTTDDPAVRALDRTLTARAFRSLPERWQSVLWYTEVEGMDPHEVAPLLGISANSVAALSYRAREGLRKAWLQAHLHDDTASGECQWTISRIGDHARRGLGSRDEARMGMHLAECARCSIVSEEVDEVGSRLALVMMPILLGGVVGGAFLASLGGANSAMASNAVIPPLPAVVVAGSVGVGSSLPALVGTIALAAVISGAALVYGPAASTPQPSQSGSSVEGGKDLTAVLSDVDATSTIDEAAKTGQSGLDQVIDETTGIVDSQNLATITDPAQIVKLITIETPPILP
jgi:RNA polymerase sigma factor (sigma-70 family)